MKLPFDFGVQLFFRLLVPGAILTLGLYPIVLASLDRLGLSRHYELGLTLAVLVLGWGTILADMPAYMLLEGRRFWPMPLWRFMKTREARRLKQLMAAVASADLRVRREASVEYRQFPLNQDGEPEALFPTRLGNAIAAFEAYPLERYGMDAVFYWPRLWLKLSKDARDSLDGGQAMVDSGVYATISFAVSGLAWGVYGALTYLGYAIGHTPALAVSASISVMCAAAARVVYWSTTFANAQFAEIFKATFDVEVTHEATFNQNVVNIDYLVAHVALLASDDRLKSLPRHEKTVIAWRYLNNYRIWCRVCDKSIPVPRFVEHAELHSGERRSPDSGPR